MADSYCPEGEGFTGRESLQKGYGSIEEQVQDYIRLFLALQQAEEEKKEALFSGEKKRIMKREAATRIFLPAVCLRDRYALTETEYWLVMLAFCLEVEGGLCLDFGEKSQGRQPNLQYGLHLLSSVLSVDFELIGELCGRKSVLGEILRLPGSEQAGLLSEPLTLEAGAFRFLLDGGIPDSEVLCSFLPDEAVLPEGQGVLALHEGEYDRLCRCFSLNEPVRILLHGVQGSGKHTLLKRVCRETGSSAVFVKTGKFLKEEAAERRRLMRTLRLICRLFWPLLVLEFKEAAEVDSAAELFSGGDFPQCRTVFLTAGRAEAEAAGDLCDVRMDLRQALSEEEVRLALDSRIAAGERRSWQDELLGRYRFTIGELERRQRAVRLLAGEADLSLGERAPWEAGLKEHSVNSGMGRILKSRYTLREIVLPKECREQLETVMRLAKRWSGEQGLNLLFHGSSGTGKTMAASALAGELGLPVFKVDLSQVFDKYIGETEKHLDEIFQVAGRGRCLLFFDEADALFGKRTGIQDAHDRYANVSTAYLLQRIEEYEGIVILATNLLDHFDDAFVRRIRFVIRFRNLEREDRERMWDKAFEDGPPLAEDVSAAELARAAELSPARIRAAAQVAGLLAECGEGGSITREHIKKALELEAGKDETAIRGL